MLATQANHLVTSGELEKGCFVRLSAYQANQVRDKKYAYLKPHPAKEALLTSPRILIVLNLDVLKEHGKREKIGNPVSLEQELATRGPIAAPVQPQQSSATSFYGNKPAAAAVPAKAPTQNPTKYVSSYLGLATNSNISRLVPVALELLAKTVSIPLKLYLLTKTSGPSRLVSRRNRISKPGTTLGVKAGFLRLPFLTKLARSVPQGSVIRLKLSTRCSRKVRYITSPNAESIWRNDNTPTSITTTN